MKEKLLYISNNIKSYRVRSGFTQEDMSNKLNVSRQTYMDYELNPQKVKVETLQQIADMLNCKLEDFFVKINVTQSNDNENI